MPARTLTPAGAATGSIPHPAAAKPVETCGVDPRRWLVFPVLLAGAVLAPLDFFIVNVALPAIQTGLGTTAAHLQLVIAAYTVAYAVLLVTGGRLGDIYGRKWMFMGGMGIFAFASALCGFATSANLLIVGRLVQGVGSAIMVPQVLASIRMIFPAEERGRALGIYGAVFGFAAILGQLAGGVLIALHPFGLTWRAIFLVNLPICGVALIAAAKLFRQTVPPEGARLDLPGILLLTASLVLLVYPAVEGREAGWPIWAFICLAAALPVFLLFLYVEQKMTAQGGAPLLDIRLFRNRTFVLGLGMTFLLYSAASFFLTFAIYLENGLGWAPLATSLAILPFGIGFFIAPFTASTLTRYLGVGILLAAYGLLVAGFASVIGELLVYGVPTNAMYGGLFCCGFGMGLSLPSLIRILLQEVPPQESGVAAGMINSALQIGAALNVATVGGVFFSVLGNRSDSWSYAQAFAATLGCVAAGYCISLVLAFALWRRKAGDA